MTKLSAIQSKIQKLQAQAAQLRTSEVSAVIEDIQAKMKAFGITIADLRNAKPAKAASKTAGKKTAKGSKTAGVKVAAKFRGPNGETWSGRGLAPKWLTALEAAGRNRSEFAVS